MQSSPYGESVISAQTWRLKIIKKKLGNEEENIQTFAVFFLLFHKATCCCCEQEFFIYLFNFSNQTEDMKMF